MSPKKLSFYDYCVANNKLTLVSEWDKEKNEALTPQNVPPQSGKKVWWQCKEGHEWQALVSNRTRGSGCPYCTGQRVKKGVNDLASVAPDLAAEWHPTKNEGLTPQDVTPKSGKRVWWRCTEGHEWQALVYNRSNGTGCPHCAQQRAIKGGDTLANRAPDLAAEWHPTLNGDLIPETVMAQSQKKVWWQCKEGHEWQAIVFNRTNGTGCPYCAGHRVKKGFNDLATVAPTVAAQWHPTKNGELSPEAVTANSGKKVWWQCKEGHEWQATINNRTSGSGCPCCAWNRVVKGVNDLATVAPDIAAEWHPTKNGDLTPETITAKSNKRVWWKCEHGHEWQVVVKNRLSGPGCPYCTGHRVKKGFNDLATVEPDLAAQWHPTLNGDLTPETIAAKSGKKVWWKCEHGHEWQAQVYNRTTGSGCPFCYPYTRETALEKQREMLREAKEKLGIQD